MNTTTTSIAEPWNEIVRRKVSAMRYGSVLVTVHDGRVTQVEATEKTRLPLISQQDESLHGETSV